MFLLSRRGFDALTLTFTSPRVCCPYLLPCRSKRRPCVRPSLRGGIAIDGPLSPPQTVQMKTSSQSPSFSTKTNQARGQGTFAPAPVSPAPAPPVADVAPHRPQSASSCSAPRAGAHRSRAVSGARPPQSRASAPPRAGQQRTSLSARTPPAARRRARSGARRSSHPRATTASCRSTSR